MKVAVTNHLQLCTNTAHELFTNAIVSARIYVHSLYSVHDKEDKYATKLLMLCII